ncbi:MAG: hypothetical protein ACE144_10890 [Thermodesulfobacteriota bacterium]
MGKKEDKIKSILSCPINKSGVVNPQAEAVKDDIEKNGKGQKKLDILHPVQVLVMTRRGKGFVF